MKRIIVGLIVVIFMLTGCEMVIMDNSVNESVVLEYEAQDEIIDGRGLICLGEYANGYKTFDVWVNNNYAYIAQLYGGMSVLDVSDASSISEVGNNIDFYWTRKIFYDNDYVYAADRDSGMIIYDVSDKSNQTVAGVYYLISYIDGIMEDAIFEGNYVYIAPDYGNFTIVDVSDKTNPVLVGECNVNGRLEEILLDGNYAYVAAYEGGLQIIDISDKSNPFVVNSYNTPSYALSLCKNGNILYVGDLNGISYLNIGNPLNIGYYTYQPMYAKCWSMELRNEYIFLANDINNLVIIDPDLDNPIIKCNYNQDEGISFGLFIDDETNLIYTADGYSGIRVYQSEILDKKNWRHRIREHVCEHN